MTDRPESLRLLAGYFVAARIAREYVWDLYRELAEHDGADSHARKLLHESASIAIEQMPALTRQLRGLESEWAEQELLDPPAAERTIERLEGDLAELVPTLAARRVRQNQIVAEILDRISQAH